VGNDLTIHSRTGALTLRDLDAWVRTDQATTEATIQFLPANSTTQSPLTITVRRDRSDEYPATEWLLDTQGTSLPCSALAEYLPQLESLGSEATFRGSLHWRQQQEHWSIDLAGSRFEGISLDRLFEQNAHRISGTATVQLDRCRIEPHLRRSDLSGSIRSHNGWIGGRFWFPPKSTWDSSRGSQSLGKPRRGMCRTIDWHLASISTTPSFTWKECVRQSRDMKVIRREWCWSATDTPWSTRRRQRWSHCDSCQRWRLLTASRCHFRIKPVG
jgi:hypothetical protein